MQAWDITVREFQRHCVILDSACDIALEESVADILCSTLVEDCLGRGKPIKEGGAVYDFISGLQVGIANLGDSLAAIKKCVFEDRTVTAAELWDALASDFVGERGEEIRVLLDAAPKSLPSASQSSAAVTVRSSKTHFLIAASESPRLAMPT